MYILCTHTYMYAHRNRVVYFVDASRHDLVMYNLLFNFKSILPHILWTVECGCFEYKHLFLTVLRAVHLPFCVDAAQFLRISRNPLRTQTDTYANTEHTHTHACKP